MRILATAVALLLAGCATLPERGGPVAAFDWVEYRGGDPVDAATPAAPGTYRNPILAGFHPDPSITRVGDDYYLVTSTFAWFPGIPVFHSRDLVSWRQIGSAIDRPDQLDFGTLGLSRGVFAPAIEHHRGTFIILNTCVDCGGNFLVTATDPAGPWSDPIWLPDLEGGIDPSLFVDEEGSAWILNNGPPVGTPRYDGHRAIWIQRFDLATNRTVGPRTVLIDGGVDPSTNPIWIEGPHIYKVDGRYVLTAAEGGTAEGHSQVALRADRPDGPYTPFPGNPVLTQRDLPRDRPFPITSAGHADLVQLPDGSWWATFLAVRPYQGDDYNTGRETFLLPVEWRDGWPRITGPGEVIAARHRRPAMPPAAQPGPPSSGAFAWRESFDAPLPPGWLMMRNPRETWHDIAEGALRLTARPVGLGANGNPSFLARRQQHANVDVSAELDFAPARDGDAAGLAALQNDAFWYAIAAERRNGATAVTVRRRAGEDEPGDGTVLAAAPLAGRGPVRLRIVERGALISFQYAVAGGEWRPLLEDADATVLSTRRAGGFVGTMIGPFAVRAAD